MRIDVEARESKLAQDRAAFESERALILAEKQEKVQLQFELKEQMQGMEVLTEEISKKEKFIRQETEKLELLAAKLTRKEKTIN